MRLPVWPLRIASAALALVMVLLAGCGRPTPADQAGGEIRLGYFANLTHAQAVLGVASGDFEKAVAPAKLTARLFNAGPSLIEALFAGEIDIGYIGPGPAINGYAKSKGRGLKVISGAAANGVAIVVRRDSGIHKLEDLKGKRIATPQLGNTQDIAARHFLMYKLGQADANNVIPIANAEQLGLMRRGRIDAAWAPEPWAARLVSEAGGILLAEEKDLWEQKRFPLAVVIASPAFMRNQPDAARRFLAVHRAWTERLTRDAEATLPLLGKALKDLTGKSLSQETLNSAFARTIVTDDPMIEVLDTFAQWSFDLGFAKEKAILDGLVDVTMLDSAKHE